VIALLAFGLALLLFAALLDLGRLREWHHGYMGILLAGLGVWLPLRIAGLVILADDVVQHLIQTRWPDYRSPLHRAYGVLYRIPAVRRLNEWLDSLFR
jgi:hypothetical protein